MSVSQMPSEHLIVAVLLIGFCLGALALYVGLGGWKVQPGENAQPENVETFSLIGGENKRLVIDETEIILRLETTWVGPMARVTYFINDENTTKELNVGDVVLELPGGKIVLELASDFVEHATFKVSGNFQILSSVENVELTYLWNHMQEFENKRIRTSGVVVYYLTPRPTETIGDFMLANPVTSISVLLVDRELQIPPENSRVVVEGTVACAYGFYIEGFYYIRADNWAYALEDVDLSFENISHVTYGIYDNHKYLVIENSEEWGRVWLSAMPEYNLAPEINFSTHMVIAVFMGGRSTGGYGITIERIIEGENEIIVNVNETYPGRIMVTEAFTWPHYIIKVERVQKPIVFEVQQFRADAYDENWNPYDEIMYELLGEYRVEAGSGPPEPSI